MAVPWLAAATFGGALLQNHSNAQEASRNRAFQANLSNTAHQRAQADLRAAGLNPLLAAGSPASTPGGAQARHENTGAALAQGASAQAQVRQVKAQTALVKAQTAGVEFDTDLKKQRLDYSSRLRLPPGEVGQSLNKALGRGADEFQSWLKSEHPDIYRMLPWLLVPGAGAATTLGFKGGKVIARLWNAFKSRGIKVKPSSAKQAATAPKKPKIKGGKIGPTGKDGSWTNADVIRMMKDIDKHGPTGWR